MMTTATLKIGQRIVAGVGEDQDTGVVDSIDGSNVTVRWASLQVTTQPMAALFDWDQLTQEAVVISGISDGTGTLGIVARQARLDHPGADASTLAEIIREIWDDATAEHAANAE